MSRAENPRRGRTVRLGTLMVLGAALTATPPVLPGAPSSAPVAAQGMTPAPAPEADTPGAVTRNTASGQARPEPFTPPAHWSRGALRRLAGAGLLTPGETAGAWPLPRSRVRTLLRDAAVREAEGPSAGGNLAAGFLRRFEAEFPDPEPAGSSPLTGRLDLGWLASQGEVLGGTHEPWEEDEWIYRGPVPAPEHSSPMLNPSLDLAPAAFLGLRADVRVRPGRLRGEELYAFAPLGGTWVWAGRRHLAYGPPTARGLVLSGAVPFDGMGVEVIEGFRLPRVLDRLGPVRASTLLARMQRSGEVERPWFWAARVSLQPHDDLVIGLNRASIFGGEGNEPVTFRNVGLMLLGFTETDSKSSDFENQVASVDALWRTRLAGVPLVVYGEWGFSDVGGAWFRVPGIVGGLELPAFPGLQALAIGVEHASFSGHGGGHPPWYRHGPLGEGWTDRGRLLGHPLGGHGTEWSAHLSLDPPTRDLLVASRIFQRHRGGENLLARNGAESTLGAELGLSAHGPRRLVLQAQLEWEEGRSGWRAWSARMSAGMGF